ncbi:MAG: DUF3857 domain-containing protein [Mucilaginibacter sp.]|uniref:DUF3857 domain-containing protein n=1 Tax=Mucilaginibacter sp. TaxID=1882438 RepID=UPI003264AA2A
MKKLLLLILLLFTSNLTHAQKYKTTQPYGVVDTADLLLKDCDFEKNASAMVLFDKAEVSTELEDIHMTRHKRIKIFNDAGKRNNANERLVYYAGDGHESIYDVQAQTINMEGDKIVITKLDPKTMYTDVIDKYHKALVFAYPQVRSGSVIELTYKWKTDYAGNFPKWNFQGYTPTRYSELYANISGKTQYNAVSHGYQPFVLDSNVKTNGFLDKFGYKCWWAKANIPSYVVEPFVTEGSVNLQSIDMQLHSLRSGFEQVIGSDTWKKITFEMMYDEDFGMQLNVGLPNEDVLIKKAKALPTTDEKIAYLFNEVKTSITWDKYSDWETHVGTKEAWKKKTGNSAEINLILYHLLNKAGVDVYPMAASTRNNGSINPDFADYAHINTTLAFIPATATSKYYVLDASSKYNIYNEVPREFLNTYGIMIMPKDFNNKSKLIYLKNESPANQVVIINGEIKPNSVITGTADISNYSYNRAYYHDLYDRLGEKNYTKELSDASGHIKIWDLAMENTQADSLPLIQKFKFETDLGTTDGNYIYFIANLLTPVTNNPFVNEKRNSDIDFGSCSAYNIHGNYILPAGYKVDALPKPLVMSMSDKSITFKRVIGEANGILQVHFTISINRSLYNVAEYKSLHEFYKKMFDMLNEPIVLKKG